MKFKKIFVIFFIAFIILYFIYKFNFKENLTYLVIGDDLAKGHTPFDTYGNSYTDYLFDYLKENKNYKNINKAFIEEDLRIKDLISELDENKTKDKETLSQLIRKADLITIGVGSEDLFSKMRSNKDLLTNNNKRIYNTIDKMTEELNELITKIRTLSKKPIYIIGYYNPLEYSEETEITINSIFNYIDLKYKGSEKDKNIKYIKIYEGFKNHPEYLPNKSNAFPSLEGYNYISEQIIQEIKES